MPDQTSLGDPMLWFHTGFWAVSLVLIGSGSAKIVDPTGFVRFLSDSSGRLIPAATGRVVGGMEALLGFVALAVGGRVIAVAVAVTYGLFTIVVAVAIAKGAPSCGCFGAASSRPRIAHLVMNVASVVLALIAAVGNASAIADGLRGLGSIAAVLVLVATVVGATAAIFVDTR